MYEVSFKLLLTKITHFFASFSRVDLCVFQTQVDIFIPYVHPLVTTHKEVTGEWKTKNIMTRKNYNHFAHEIYGPEWRSATVWTRTGKIVVALAVLAVLYENFLRFY